MSRKVPVVDVPRDRCGDVVRPVSTPVLHRDEVIEGGHRVRSGKVEIHPCPRCREGADVHRIRRCERGAGRLARTAKGTAVVGIDLCVDTPCRAALLLDEISDLGDRRTGSAVERLRHTIDSGSTDVVLPDWIAVVDIAKARITRGGGRGR